MTALHAADPGRKSNSGLSLLELLVGSFIGLLAVTGILYLYKSQQRNMLTQSGLADMRMNGQFALNEAQYYLSHAGLGLPANLEDIQVLGGDLAVKMNVSRKSATAVLHASSGRSRAVYRIAAGEAGPFLDMPYAVILAGNQALEAEVLSVSADPPGGGDAYVALRGGGDAFPASATLFPMERLRLHISDGSGPDAEPGDFQVFSEREPGLNGSAADSLTLAEGIESLSFSYFMAGRRDSVTVLPADLDSLKSIRIQVVARTLKSDVHLPGDGFRRQTLAAKINYRRSL